MAVYSSDCLPPNLEEEIRSLAGGRAFYAFKEAEVWNWREGVTHWVGGIRFRPDGGSKEGKQD